MMKKLRWSPVGVLALAFLGVASATSAQKASPDLKKVRNEMGIVESVLNQSLGQTFGEPFGYLEKVRGAYLPGYGAAFSFEVNLTPSNSLGPFSSRPTAEGMKEQREEAVRRKDQAKTLAENALADFGSSLTDLETKESVAVVIYTLAVQPSGVTNGTVVISCDKQLIDAFRANSIDRATFLRRLTVVEY